jgi:16S rRNA (cytidine1402-2'-O)-methyltransferase
VTSKPSLYVVPTPIGNLGDITFRAVEVLRSADLILAEDTRTSGVLFRHLAIARPVQSFHIFNEHKTLAGLLRRMQEGEVIALVSDAGTPGISDPGFLLVRQTLEAGLAVECLPGPTAFVPALISSGFPCDRFVFEGFLPHKKGRQSRMRMLAEEERTIVLYESPHRLVKTLEQWRALVGNDRRVSVSRELTKIHEETKTGPVGEVISYFSKKEVKGEIVLVIDGKKT